MRRAPKTKRVPAWVRALRPGCLRGWLATIFLGPGREQRRNASIW